MKKIIQTQNAPGAIGPYSQGIAANGFLYASGQLPIDITTGALEAQDMGRAATLCLKNLAAIWEAAGASAANVVKVTVFMTDLGRFDEMNAAYAAFFGDEKPARACVQVAALPKGAQVEIEAVVAL